MKGPCDLCRKEKDCLASGRVIGPCEYFEVAERMAFRKRGGILMQREILFRGFHPCDGPDTIVVDGEKVKGEWVYGNLFVNKLTGQHMIIAPNKEIDRFDYITVTPSTVGQYTGLKDKNGKRIFEGDIVDGVDFSEEDGYGVVQWDDGAFEVIGNSICGTFHENYWGMDFEVIGTLFDEVNDNAET